MVTNVRSYLQTAFAFAFLVSCQGGANLTALEVENLRNQSLRQYEQTGAHRHICHLAFAHLGNKEITESERRQRFVGTLLEGADLEEWQVGLENFEPDMPSSCKQQLLFRLDTGGTGRPSEIIQDNRVRDCLLEPPLDYTSVMYERCATKFSYSPG